MDFDWTKPMVIDWSGRNGPVIKEEDIKYSVIKRIIRNQYTAPLCNLQFTRVKPQWSPHDPFATNVGNNRSRSYRNFIPGLHPVPPYPQLSTLTKAQHQEAVRVLSAKYHSVQPRDYVLPNEKSYQVFQEIQELYEIEQKEYKNWAKQLWINGDCIRALRPKPIIEKVYEAEFKMRSTEIQSLPKNYRLAAQIPLETKNHIFEFEHKRDLINVDIQDLPIVDYPDVMGNDFSVLKPYPIPEPCTEHPCKFLLPGENSVSVLPLSEIQHVIGQYAIENGVSFAASENALRCLVETDRSWKIPVAVLEAVGPDGDLRNVVVLGSEFGVQKECATQRTYKAYKHLLRHTFAPSTGHYQIKTPLKQTTLVPTSVPPIEKPVASNYNRLDTLDTDLVGSSDDEDKLLIDDIQKCQPNLAVLDSELISEQDGPAIDDFTREPECEHGDKSNGESNSKRNSGERRSEPDRYIINDIDRTSEQDGLAVEDFTKDELCNNGFGIEPEAEHGNKSDGELNSERNRDERRSEPCLLMIDENDTNPELSYSNHKPSYYQDSYEPDFFNAEERLNYGHNKPSSDSDQVMIDDASDLEPRYSTNTRESSYSIDTSDRPETIKPWMNEPTYSNYSRESSYTNTEESRYSIDNTAKPKTITPWMSDSTYSKNASDLNYCIVKESSYSFHTVGTSINKEPNYNNECCESSFSTNKESTCSNKTSKPIYINKESNYTNKSSEPSYSIDKISNLNIASKPNDSKKEPGVRRLSFNETVPANTEKSIVNYSANSDPKNLEANKPMSNSVKPKAEKISLLELFGDGSDSDDSICTNTNIYIDITAKKNNIRASSESKIISTSKPINIEILNSDRGTEPCTNLNCRKLSDPIIVVIEKSPPKPSLRKASVSEPSPGKSNKKLSFSDPLTSDPEFRVYHSESDSEESLAGFNNEGIAVSTNETKKKHECVPDGLRTRKKPIAKYAAKKSQTKQTKNKVGFTKTVPTKKKNNQNNKIEKVIPRRSRRISALLHSDSNDDSNYSETSRRTSTRIKNNKQMEVERPGVIRRRRLSSCVCPEDSDETKTNINAKVLTENTKVLRRSRRLSVLNVKENVQPKSNKTKTSVHKSHETNTNNKIAVNSNSLSKVTKKYRRKSLPTNIFSKKEKNNQVHTRSNSLNLYDIAKLNESLRSNSRSSSSTPLHAIDKNKTSEISERTKRYFYRSVSSIYLETDRSEDKVSESTKRYLQSSISSACSETEQAYSDLRNRTKKYTRRSNTTLPCAKKTSTSKTAAVLNVELIDDGELSDRTKRHKSRSMNLAYSSCDESEQPKTIRNKKTRRPPEKNHSYLSHTATIDQPTTTRLNSEVRDTTENQTDSINPIELGLSDANENGTETCKIKIDIVEKTTDKIEMVTTKRMQIAERNQMDTSEDNFNTEAQSLDRYKSADKYEEYNIIHFRVTDTEGPDLESSNTDDTLYINHTLDSLQTTDENKILDFPETNKLKIDITEVNASEREDDLFTFQITNTLSNENNETNAANQTESNEANQIEPEKDITNLTESNDIIQFRKLSISEVSDNSDYYFENNDTELNIYHFTARNETDTENESQKDSPTVGNPRLADNGQPCSSKINTETVIHQKAERTGDKTQKCEIDQPGSSGTQNRFYNYQSNITETNKMEPTVPLNTAENETNYFDRGRKNSVFPSGSSEDLNHEPFDASELSRQAIDDIIGVNNCVCKGSLFETPPPRSFKKWQVRNTTSNLSFSLIVHSSHKARNGSKEVLLEPIVEYQPELGGAKQSAENIRSIALALMIRENAELINARIDHENGNVIVIENLSEAEFISRHGDQRSNVADTLHTAINQLRFLLPGQYVLAHDACHGANAMLYTSRGAGAARGAPALSLHQDAINMPDAEDALHAKVPPELDGILLPYHKFRSTAPLAFTPYPRQVREERRAALARAKHPPHAIQWPKKKKCKRSRH